MDSINREIIRLSIPTIVSNITVPLLGICDTAISGHLGSELFLSAIAVGSVMLNVVFWIFGFLRGGTTGLTANALGGKNDKEISRVFYRSLSIGMGAGVILILLQGPIYDFLLMVVGADSEIQPYLQEYFSLRIWGSPALLATIAISGWFVGMQNTFFPMVIAIMMNVFNIGLSCWLVYGADYGFAGVAAGTMLSNWTGLLVALGCILWFMKGKLPGCDVRNFLKGEWWKYFSVNGNLFLRSFFIICVTLGVTSAGARIGNLTLAVNAIVMQFFLFFSFFMDGFAFSGEAMVGLRWGEKNFPMLGKCVRRLLEWTLATGLIFSFIYLCGSGTFTSLLTDRGNVIEQVESLTLWIVLIPIVSCWAFIFDGFYIGITATRRMMISAALGAILFFLILSPLYLAEGWGENRLIWTAFLVYLAARGIYLGISFPRVVVPHRKMT